MSDASGTKTALPFVIAFVVAAAAAVIDHLININTLLDAIPKREFCTFVAVFFLAVFASFCVIHCPNET